MDFTPYIRDIEDFPKPGVVFKDITPLLKDPHAFKKAGDALLGFTSNMKIDKVVGVDSRGFIFAPMLAEKLGAGFVTNQQGHGRGYEPAPRGICAHEQLVGSSSCVRSWTERLSVASLAVASDVAWLADLSSHME